MANETNYTNQYRTIAEQLKGLAREVQSIERVGMLVDPLERLTGIRHQFIDQYDSFSAE